MQIKKFTPVKFERIALNIDKLNEATSKQWEYASTGRASLYHMLKSVKNHNNKILVPTYFCVTILTPIRDLGFEPIFYDIDITDLNPSFESLKFLSLKYDVKIALVASMYGNPANVIEIEKFCKENKILMIDDAAQSFGAKIDNKYIGTFGDAGFFSFSPGKPNAGHMGCFFWSNKNITINYVKNTIMHKIIWLDFLYNRYLIYDKRRIVFKILRYLTVILRKYFKLYNSGICEFEKDILGGILMPNILGNNVRQSFHDRFFEHFKLCEHFRIIKAARGIPNNHKFILVFINKYMASNFINHMQENNIYTSNGHILLEKTFEYTENSKKIDGCVVEIPIEDDLGKYKYLCEVIENYVSTLSGNNKK